MNLSRKFLRVAALGAVFALGLTGTALAAETYVITGDAVWTNTGIAGGSTATTNDDTVIIKEGAVLTATTDGGLAAKVLDMAGGKLIVNGTANDLTIAAGAGVGEIRVSKKGSVIQLGRNDAAAIKILQGAANAPVVLSDDADLTIEKTSVNGGITGAGAVLEIKGKGTLVLKAQVATVNGLKIEEGATLVAEVDDALPALGAAPEIAKGNLVVNAEDFGKTTTTSLTLKDGDLTLNKSMHNTVVTVEIQNGRLTVAGDAKIGAGDGTDGLVTLGKVNGKGRLVLTHDITLKGLDAANGENEIETNGKTLGLKPAAGIDINALVTGNVSVEPSGIATVKLGKNVNGEVRVKANVAGTTLELAEGVKVDVADFIVNDASLTLNGQNVIGRLGIEATKTLKVTSGGASGKNYIGYLKPGAAATMNMLGASNLPLVIEDGEKVDWKAELAAGTQLQVKGRDLLQKTVEMKFAGAELILPSGEFPDLKLHATDDGAAISVDVAAQDPVLKVKEIEVNANKTLTVNRPDTWCLTLSGDVTLLTAPTVNLNGNGDIKGAPESDDVALIKLNTTKTALILTPRAGLKFPVLKGTPTSSGNQCNVLVKVVDGKVDAASWEWELNVLPLGSATHSILAAGTTESVLYGVQLADNFQSGFLRVRAKKAGSTVCGVVDVPLKRGAVDGTPDSGKVGADLKKPESWSRTAISGDSVVLTSKLKLDGTPKSLKVKASGMKNEPKAELLDAAGKVVAKSSVPSVSAVKDYTLKLTCKTTQAEIDKGAKIERVTVTMSDGKTHTILVNVKLSDMKIGTPDGKKPGGDNGGGKTPGGDNGGGKNPGGEDGGGKNPGGENDGKKGSSGGGCDAGFGGLALALGAAFLLRRKA